MNMDSGLSQGPSTGLRHFYFKPSTLHLALAACLIGLLHGLIQWFVLLHANLAEDAFILFEYVNHFIQGHGIAYNADAVPVEGATDFLWFFLLSLLGFLGVVPPVAAAALNSVGFFLVAWVFLNLVQGESDPAQCQPKMSRRHKSASVFVWLVLLIVLLFSHFAYASYAGFSTGLYAGLFMIALKRLIALDPASFRDVPLLAITLGLFRPDGVILGVALVAIKSVSALGSSHLKALLKWNICAFVIGVVYFLWRWHYFGMALPLPLYVKSGTNGALPGLSANLSWVYENIHWWLLVGVITFMSKSWSRLIVLVPGFLLLFALTFSTQSQNVGSRFQMPMFISLLFYVAWCWPVIRSHLSQPLLFPIFLAAVHVFMCLDDLPQKMQSRLGGQHYVAPFAKLIDPYVDSRTVFALTEAGRLAYFNDAHIVDLVGLNDPALAKSPVTVEYIESLKPDLLFFYQGFKLSSLESKEPVVHQTAKQFLKSINQNALYVSGEKRVLHTASVAIDFIQKNGDDYDVYRVLMPEHHSYQHVFAIRKGYSGKAEIISALFTSHQLPSDYFSVDALN